MPITTRTARCTAVAAAVAVLAMAAPQVAAADGATASGVRISSRADSTTRAIAASDPKAVRAAATVCGSGYELYGAERLPDARRFGTLFRYDNGGLGSGNTECDVFDNNLPSAQYLKLRLCENKVSSPRCSVDEGNYSQYAGPVYMNNCPTVTAIMKETRSSLGEIIDAVRGSFCN